MSPKTYAGARSWIIRGSDAKIRPTFNKEDDRYTSHHIDKGSDEQTPWMKNKDLEVVMNIFE